MTRAIEYSVAPSGRAPVRCGSTPFSGARPGMRVRCLAFTTVLAAIAIQPTVAAIRVHDETAPQTAHTPTSNATSPSARTVAPIPFSTVAPDSPPLEGLLPGGALRSLIERVGAAADAESRRLFTELAQMAVGRYVEECELIGRSIVDAERGAGWELAWASGEEVRWNQGGWEIVLWAVPETMASRTARAMAPAYECAYARLDHAERTLLEELSAIFAAASDEESAPDAWRRIESDALRSAWIGPIAEAGAEASAEASAGALIWRVDVPALFRDFLDEVSEGASAIRRTGPCLSAEVKLLVSPRDDGSATVGDVMPEAGPTAVGPVLRAYREGIDAIIRDVLRPTRVESALWRYRLAAGNPSARAEWAMLAEGRADPCLRLAIATGGMLANAVRDRQGDATACRWNRVWRSAIAPMAIDPADEAEIIAEVIRPSVGEAAAVELETILLQHRSQRCAIEQRLLECAVDWWRDSIGRLEPTTPTDRLVRADTALRELEGATVSRLVELTPSPYHRRLVESAISIESVGRRRSLSHWSHWPHAVPHGVPDDVPAEQVAEP